MREEEALDYCLRALTTDTGELEFIFPFLSRLLLFSLFHVDYFFLTSPTCGLLRAAYFGNEL